MSPAALRWIALTAAALCPILLTAAMFITDGMAVGAFLAGALVAAATAVGIFGYSTQPPRVTSLQMFLLQLISIAGLIGMAAGYPICFVGVAYSAVVMILRALSNWSLAAIPVSTGNGYRGVIYGREFARSYFRGFASLTAIIFLDIAILILVLGFGPRGDLSVAVFVVNYFVFLFVIRRYMWWLLAKQKTAGMVKETVSG